MTLTLPNLQSLAVVDNPDGSVSLTAVFLPTLPPAPVTSAVADALLSLPGGPLAPGASPSKRTS